ncbi:MAG: amino acid permease [Chloroflexi bacterium]|nr:amino acid permease [Chloroflexota bacterium]
MMILILAANTGYQDFPRLSSFLAKDGFMPRWMTHRGDRLVYSYGIVVLAFLASLLILVFQADEIAMLPLYALGVMLSFTLSQSGMVLLMGKIGKLKPGESFFTGVTTIHFEKGWPWKRLLKCGGGGDNGRCPYCPHRYQIHRRGLGYCPGCAFTDCLFPQHQPALR